MVRKDKRYSEGRENECREYGRERDRRRSRKGEDEWGGRGGKERRRKVDRSVKARQVRRWRDRGNGVRDEELGQLRGGKQKGWERK